MRYQYIHQTPRLSSSMFHCTCHTRPSIWSSRIKVIRILSRIEKETPRHRIAPLGQRSVVQPVLHGIAVYAVLHMIDLSRSGIQFQERPPVVRLKQTVIDMGIGRCSTGSGRRRQRVCRMTWAGGSSSAILSLAGSRGMTTDCRRLTKNDVHGVWHIYCVG